MATQTVEFRAPSGQTITAKLFAALSDTEVASVSATEATNRKGTYSAAYTDVPAGEYELIALVSTTPVARWFTTLTLTTATFATFDNVNTVQISGDATAANNAESFFDGTGYAGTNNVIPTVTTVNGLANNALTAAALAADAVAEIQSGLATSAVQTQILDTVSYNAAALYGACADPQTSAETYAITINGSTYTLDYTSQTSVGVRGTTTRTKS